MSYDDQEGLELRGAFATYRIVRASRVSLDKRNMGEPSAFARLEVDRWITCPNASRKLHDLAAGLGAPGRSPWTRGSREDLRRVIRRAFDDRTLVAFAEPSDLPFTSGGSATPASRPAQPSASPGPAPAPAPAPALTWIAIELRDSEDIPIAGSRYTITLPDFSDRSGALDDLGRARLDGIEPGVCGVVFHDYAAEDWGAQAKAGGGLYTVVQGDCLSSIAARFGFGDWRTIYQAKENEAFRAMRPDPNAIYPGDQLFIPGRDAEPAERMTSATHLFHLRSAATRLRVRVQMGFPFPVQHLYQLTVDGAEHEGSVVEGAVVDVPVPADATAGRLSVWPQLGYALVPFEWSFQLGGLDPASELSGVQGRLNNLGVRCGAVDGLMGPKTGAALCLFQAARGLGMTGAADDTTREALRVVHDVG